MHWYAFVWASFLGEPTPEPPQIPPSLLRSGLGMAFVWQFYRKVRKTDSLSQCSSGQSVVIIRSNRSQVYVIGRLMPSFWRDPSPDPLVAGPRTWGHSSGLFMPLWLFDGHICNVRECCFCPVCGVERGRQSIFSSLKTYKLQSHLKRCDSRVTQERRLIRKKMITSEPIQGPERSGPLGVCGVSPPSQKGHHAKA
jgi:hypothetical protein